MGCDTVFLSLRAFDSKFQSTHPVWDATRSPRIGVHLALISIHASRMGCDWMFGLQRFEGIISIHASRMGCDLAAERNPGVHAISIHASRMGCDATCRWRSMRQAISIHASRMGCDGPAPVPAGRLQNFNPRIPYGMRLREWTLHSIIWKFLPALRADYIADIPEHLSVCIFGL